MPDTRTTTEDMASIQQSLAELSKMMNQMLKNQEEKKAKQTHMIETLEQIQSSVDELLPASARSGKQSVLEPDSPPLLATPPGFVSYGFSDQPLQIHKSEVVVVASCEEIKKSDLVVDDQVSLLLSSDSFLIEDAPKPTEYFTINYSSDLSNNEVVMEVDETPELEISFSFSNLNLNSCSPSVCKNASEDWPSYLTMQTDFHSYNLLPKLKVRCVKPPAKPPDDIFTCGPKTDIVWLCSNPLWEPPDDIYNLHIDGLSIWWKISGVFTSSPHANHRKGGLISLAAAKVGLTSEASQHLEQIIPHVLKAFTDQDSRVRCYACEALYNIVKVVRGDCIIFFNDIFNALCKLAADSDANMQSAAHLLDRLVKDIVTESDQFSIEEFIPLLRERMNVLSPFVRQFLVEWITVLDSVPDIDMLGFLPDFLDGLFNMLSDSSHEIRQQADSALSEFLQEIKNSPSVDYGRMAETLVQGASSLDEFTRLTLHELVKLRGDQLIRYYADILVAVLPCISDWEEKIRVVARETNEELRGIKADTPEGFDVSAMLSIARRQLSSEWDGTRIEALLWLLVLLNRYRAEVPCFLKDIFDALLEVLSDPSNEVVLLVIEVLACIVEDQPHFQHLVVSLLRMFQYDNSLLEKWGFLITRRLCVLSNAEKAFRQLSSILQSETDLEFASGKESLVTPSGKDLFVSLYASWCHSPVSLISLCLLAQTYQHASMVIQSLVEEDTNVKFLVQLDKLINLLETPVFAYLILQLLEPTRCKWLWKALYGLLMLLPHQSAAFKILKTRLKAVPSFSFSGEYYSYPSAQSGTIILEDGYTKHVYVYRLTTTTTPSVEERILKGAFTKLMIGKGQFQQDSLASKVDLYVDDVKHRELAIVAFTMRKQLYYLIGALSNSKKLVAAVTDGSKVPNNFGIGHSFLMRVDMGNEYVVFQFETAFFIIGLKLVDLVFLVCFVNKFYIFSSPRPPEVADLEDKVNFKGRGMLRNGIIGT